MNQTPEDVDTLRTEVLMLRAVLQKIATLDCVGSVIPDTTCVSRDLPYPCCGCIARVALDEDARACQPPAESTINRRRTPDMSELQDGELASIAGNFLGSYGDHSITDDTITSWVEYLDENGTGVASTGKSIRRRATAVWRLELVKTEAIDFPENGE